MAEQGETAFKKKVLRDLKMECPEAYILKTQERARRGVLDLLICLRGVFIGIELKVPGKRPDPLQERNIRRIRRAGGFAFSTDADLWPRHLQMLKDLPSGVAAPAT